MSKKSPLVEISHTLNNMRSGYATLQEQRLFLVYLSKINPRFPKNQTIRLSLEEFSEICEIEKTRNPKMYDKITTALLQKIVIIPYENGGFEKFVLFDKSKINQDENGQWYFELSASRHAISLFFDLKKYVKFELKNVLKLKSLNQIRMYTLMKEYEYCKKFKIQLIELLEILGLDHNPETFDYRYFKRDVLEVCKKEINTATDIEINYIGIRGKGRGGKILEIEFTINKNKNCDLKKIDTVDKIAPLTRLESKSEIIQQKTIPKPKIIYLNNKLTLIGDLHKYINDLNEYYALLCDNIFSESEIMDLVEIIKQINQTYSKNNDKEKNLPEKITREYRQFFTEVAKRQETDTPVINHYKFFRKMLENKLIKYQKEQNKRLNEEVEEKDDYYDLDF